MLQMSRTTQSRKIFRKPNDDLHRTLLFVGPPGLLPERNRDALERSLPWVVVETTDNIKDISTQFLHCVSLILIDSSFLTSAESVYAETARVHPLATIVVIDSGHLSETTSSEMLNPKIVRGVLPMDLKLDVWVSVIALLLRGGEYFPKSALGFDAEKRFSTPTIPLQPKSLGTVENNISQLTQRELQILKLVSSGLQNKLIASTLHLSEHTVKIHVHNIITKLGAHNRTGASACFRDSQSSYEGAKPKPPFADSPRA
jgi:DNA-binding NarL/FixJ family response regulator